MSRSPSDTRDFSSQPPRTPPPPPTMPSRPPNSKEIPPSAPRTEDVGVRGAQGMAEGHSEVGLAPTACERCVRTGRTCRGVANARCEYCKRLKQKCTNSSGPARGKHAAVARLAVGGATPGKAPLVVPHVISFDNPASAPAQGQKRKLEDPQVGPSFRLPLGQAHAREEESSDYDGHDLPARFNKKRRTAANNSIFASRVLRHVKELEASVRRLEDVYATEMEKVENVISVLMKDMEALTGDSEREPSL